MRALIIRVAILAGGLSSGLFLWFDRRWAIPAGILTGTLLSLYKMKLYRRFLTGLSEQGEGRKPTGAVGFGLLSIFLSMGVLTAAILADRWLFMGTAVGILLPVAVILLNIFTEATRITHNRWAEWF